MSQAPGERIDDQLVEDREVTASADDRFRHEDVVSQLADLVESAATPSSIALYAPWGAGKSSIHNLLAEELRARQSSSRLVRYDAFRYAKLPLQRHFIRSLSKSLDVDTRALGEGLYEDRQSNSIRLGDSDDKTWPIVWHLLAVLAVVVAAAVLLAMALMGFVALLMVWTSDARGLDDYGETLFDLAKDNLLGFLAPAGLLALVAGAASRSLWVTRQRAAPTSEEEFGAAFETLVKKALKQRRHDRLVVFIDELDRCTSETVVETLDSLRTFLGASNCVFVVAADQAALEEALTRRAKQATPVNRSNPYYSSGSEYLDKTFHYQLHVPPLLPRRLSGFAASLVRDKPGVWVELPSVDGVVSVLIPNHVRSPRRAKTLLNAFALSYDLAKRRSEAGHIGGDLRDRATELAMLTCLRVEFPLLAAELRHHPDLIPALRAQVGLRDHERDFSHDVEELASRFLEGSERTDLLLSKDPQVADETSGTQPLSEDEVDTAQPSDDDLREAPQPHIARGQGRQLELYLRKTARVPSPRQDLVHLEGRGARFGLDAFLADELDDAGSQGDIEGVRSILDRLGDQRFAGIGALAESLDRDAAPLGEEASNLATVLLQVYAEQIQDVPETSKAQLTSQCAAAIDAHAASYNLRKEDLAGALALGLDSSTPSGLSLANSVLNHPSVTDEPDVALALVDRLSAAERLASRPVGALVGHALASGEKTHVFAQSLSRADAAAAWRVLDASATVASTALGESEAEGDEETDEESAAERRRVNDTLLTAFVELVPRRADLVERVAWIVLQSDTQEARNAVIRALREIVDTSVGIEFPGLISEVLRSSTKRSVEDFPTWLQLIHRHATDHEALSWLDALGKKTWVWRGEAEDFAEESVIPLSELRRLLESPLGAESDTTRAIVNEMAVVSTSAAAIAEADDHAASLIFCENGIVDPTVVAASRASLLEQGLATQIPPQQLTDGRIQSYYEAAIRFVAKYLSADDDLVASILASPWYPSPDKEHLGVVASATAAAEGIEVAQPLSEDEISDLIEGHARDVAETVSLWIRWFGDEPSAANRTLTSLLDHGARLEGETRQNIVAYASTLSPDDRWKFLEPELDAIPDRELRSDFLSAAGLRSVEPIRFSDKMTTIYTACSNNDQRGRVLEAWSLCSPSDTRSRTDLLQTVLYPMIDENAGAFDLVLRQHSLWTNPPEGTVTELRRRLDAAAERFGKTATANRRMEEAGIKRKRFGIFGSAYEDID